MAATYQSKSSTTLGLNATPQNVTLPSGTAEGDLLLVHFTQVGASGATTVFSVSGGSVAVTAEMYHNSDGYHASGLQYKFATSTDVSNGYIQVSGSDSYSINAVINVYRVSGLTNSTQIQASGTTVVSSSTPSYNIGLTPTAADSLLMIFGAASQSSSANASGYAIATSNPTWTEATDYREQNIGGSTDDPNVCMAYANRSQVTATGNVSITWGQSCTSYGILAVLAPTTNVTTTMDAPGVVTLSSPEKTFTLDNNFSVDAPGILTLSTPEPTISTQVKTAWTNETKPSTTWTNE